MHHTRSLSSGAPSSDSLPKAGDVLTIKGRRAQKFLGVKPAGDAADALHLNVVGVDDFNPRTITVQVTRALGTGLARSRFNGAPPPAGQFADGEVDPTIGLSAVQWNALCSSSCKRNLAQVPASELPAAAAAGTDEPVVATGASAGGSVGRGSAHGSAHGGSAGSGGSDSGVDLADLDWDPVMVHVFMRDQFDGHTLPDDTQVQQFHYTAATLHDVFRFLIEDVGMGSRNTHYVCAVSGRKLTHLGQTLFQANKGRRLPSGASLYLMLCAHLAPSDRRLRRLRRSRLLAASAGLSHGTGAAAGVSRHEAASAPAGDAPAASW